MSKINKPKTMSLEKMAILIEEDRKYFGIGLNFNWNRAKKLDIPGEWKKIPYVIRHKLTKVQFEEVTFWGIQSALNSLTGENNTYTLENFEGVDSSPTKQMDDRTN